MSFDFAYALEEGLALLPGLISMVPSTLISIAAYVLTALALYTMASRRGINHAWLSWVPGINVWILGSLSDQYRYVVKGENRTKRRALIILQIISMIITLLIILGAIALVGGVVEGIIFDLYGEEILEDVMIPLIGMLLLCIPLAGVSLAIMILRYIALYDIYTSCDPDNNVLFLVISVIFGVTEPFFLFFSRNKDGGMPPRRQEPQYMPPQPQWQPPRYEDEQPQWSAPEEPRQERTSDMPPFQPREEAVQPESTDRKDYL